MESSIIPIEAIFGTPPLANTGPILDTSLGAPSLSIEQVRGQVLSDSHLPEVDFNMSEQVDSVPLRIAREMDNLPYHQDNLEQYKEAMYHFYRLYVRGVPKPLGFVHGSFIVELPWPDYWMYRPEDRSITLTRGTNVADRNQLLFDTLDDGRMKSLRQIKPNMPLEPLRQMDNEPMPVYSSEGHHIMDVNIAAAEMFGVPQYTVVVTAWTNIDGLRFYWIPQLDDVTFTDTGPAKFDNFVTGRLHAGIEHHFAFAQGLAEKQARIPKSVTENRLKATDRVSYMTMRYNGNSMYSIQPYVQYTYEIELRPTDQPGYSDGCKNMRMYPFERVWELLAAGEVEEHAQMTLLAHFVRQGIINEGNEPKLEEIKKHLKREIEFPEIHPE